jgi:hypothetical protein
VSPPDCGHFLSLDYTRRPEALRTANRSDTGAYWLSFNNSSVRVSAPTTANCSRRAVMADRFLREIRDVHQLRKDIRSLPRQRLKSS